MDERNDLDEIQEDEEGLDFDTIYDATQSAFDSPRISALLQKLGVSKAEAMHDLDSENYFDPAANDNEKTYANKYVMQQLYKSLISKYQKSETQETTNSSLTPDALKKYNKMYDKALQDCDFRKMLQISFKINVLPYIKTSDTFPKPGEPVENLDKEIEHFGQILNEVEHRRPIDKPKEETNQNKTSQTKQKIVRKSSQNREANAKGSAEKEELSNGAKINKNVESHEGHSPSSKNEKDSSLKAQAKVQTTAQVQASKPKAQVQESNSLENNSGDNSVSKADKKAGLQGVTKDVVSTESGLNNLDKTVGETENIRKNELKELEAQKEQENGLDGQEEDDPHKPPSRPSER